MKKSTKIIIAVVAVLTVMFCALAVALGFVINHYLSPDAEETTVSDVHTTILTEQEQTATAPVVDPDSIEWDNSLSFGEDDGLINILFIGQDRREGEGRQRSDAMILCSLNPETNELSMISFMRDIYVQIPGYEDNRLNAAYAYGGFDLLKETLSLNFDVSVDCCVEVDFEGFKTMVDTVGGVDVELTATEAEIVGGGATEGVCHLDGAQTLTYVRIRKTDSDFMRTQRQRNVLKALFEKMKSLDSTQLLTFAATLLPLASTDVEQETLMMLAMQYAASIDDMEISSYRIPADGAYTNATVREMAVLIPDLSENKKHIFEEYLPLN